MVQSKGWSFAAPPAKRMSSGRRPSCLPAGVVLVYPYGIIVDRTGRRRFDEGRGLVHETWEEYSRAIHFDLPGRMAWTILDSRLLGINGYERAIRSDVPPVQATSLAELA